MTEKKWVKAQISAATLNKLIQERGFSRPIALILARRGITPEKVEDYINASLKDLGSPYLLPDTQKASARLWEAINKRERILIHGDFDVDGITATALLSWVLAQNGAQVSCFIPHRFDDGYGFTPESLEKALGGEPCDVLVTVDCGITSVEAVEKAQKKKVDVIVTDHHEPGPELPRAYALINAKLHPQLPELHCMAGVGTAFKLSHAFIKYGVEMGFVQRKTDLREVLDLVALGTIADIVPLQGENRILTRNGIKYLSRQTRPGIRALCEISGIRCELKPSDVAFKLAPRLNAAGRLGDPALAFRLLSTQSIVEANHLAATLDDYNRQRQAKEEEIFNEAKEQICRRINTDDAYSIVISGANWHQGVIGNVASRIARDYNRPAIVLTVIDGVAYGSGRSPDKGNLVDALSECADILIRYGGHPMAVGLSLRETNIPALVERFEHSVRAKFTEEDLMPSINYDGEAMISELDPPFFEELEEIGPFGQGNPQPVFRINNLIAPYVAGVGRDHARGYVRDSLNHSLPFIAFNTNVKSLPQQPWDILTTPQINEYRGARDNQLQILDLKTSGQ